jgi:hypothetical protein
MVYTTVTTYHTNAWDVTVLQNITNFDWKVKIDLFCHIPYAPSFIRFRHARAKGKRDKLRGHNFSVTKLIWPWGKYCMYLFTFPNHGIPIGAPLETLNANQINWNGVGISRANGYKLLGIWRRAVCILSEWEGKDFTSEDAVLALGRARMRLKFA